MLCVYYGALALAEIGAQGNQDIRLANILDHHDRRPQTACCLQQTIAGYPIGKNANRLGERAICARRRIGLRLRSPVCRYFRGFLARALAAYLTVCGAIWIAAPICALTIGLTAVALLAGAAGTNRGRRFFDLDLAIGGTIADLGGQRIASQERV